MKNQNNVIHEGLQNELSNVMDQVQSVACKFIEERDVPPIIKQNHFRSNKPSIESGVGTLTAIKEFYNDFGQYMTKSIGPRYLGYVTGGITPASLAGDWLASSIDQNVTSKEDTPAIILEKQTVSMLRDLLYLPDVFSGTFVTGATMSNFTSLSVAIQWLGKELNKNYSSEGITNVEEIQVLSGTSHSSISKSLSMMGVGRKRLNSVELVKGREAVDVDALEKKLKKLNGKPCIVVANAGTVNLGDFDDIKRIVKLKSKYNFWLHVDAAFGGFLAVTNRYRRLIKGWEFADSITVDCHKWLNVPYDSAVQFTKYPELQSKVFSNDADYLEGKSPDNFIHFTPENSRRFRALPVWMTLKAYGRNQISGFINQNIVWIQRLANELKALSNLNLVHPPISNVISFKIGDGSIELRDEFLENVNRRGKVFFTPSYFEDQAIIRGAAVNWTTSHDDLAIVVKSIKEVVKSLKIK